MRRTLIYLATFVVGGLISAAITYLVISRQGKPLVSSALIGGGLASIFIGTAAVGWQLEEETDREVVMSRTARTVWFTIGVVAVLANALLAQCLSDNITADN